MDKPEDQRKYALSDFIAPDDSGRHDYLGAFALTAASASMKSPASLRRITTTTTRS